MGCGPSCCVPPAVLKQIEEHKKSSSAAAGDACCLAPTTQQQQQAADPGPVFQAPARRPAIMTEAVAQKWLLSNGKKPGAKARVLCLGWAGSNSGAFKTWDLKNMEVVKVELPARNARFNEKPIHDVNLLAKKIAQACDVLGYYQSSIPLVIFGHSFGAMVGLHVARVMKKEYNYVPKQLVFGGCRPLHRWGFPMNYYREKDEDMISEMVSCGGMTKAMANDAMVVSTIIKAVKMDHLAMDKYVLDEAAEKVEAPIWAIGGDADVRCPQEQLPEWDRYTTASCQVQVFPGGHFFLKEKEADLLAWLGKVLTTEE